MFGARVARDCWRLENAGTDQRSYVWLLAGAMLASASAVQGQPVFGVVTQWGDAVPCATFRAPDLAAGTRVTIEAFDPRRTITARIHGKREACHERAFIEGSSYALDVPAGTTNIFIAPAAVAEVTDPGGVIRHLRGH